MPVGKQDLLRSVLALPRETEWAEFKVNDYEPDEIGEYLSALSNSAALHDEKAAYIVWGVEDATPQSRGNFLQAALSKDWQRGS